MDEIVWQMGRWRVRSRRQGFIVEKTNALGEIIESSEPHTGYRGKILAIKEGRMRYAGDA